MKVHELKIEESWADDILYNGKNFEIRRNDRGYQKGDLIKFKVIEDFHPVCTWECKDHPLNGKYYEIMYVLSSFGLQEGFVVLAIEPTNQPYRSIRGGEEQCRQR